MKIKITQKQKTLIESNLIDKEVEDFFSAEKGKFHLLAPIPTNRFTAAETIKRILGSENKKYNFGENIDLNDLSLVNRLRFGVYLDEVLSEKQTRGFNYEGFMAGLYNGYLPRDVNYWFDYRISQGTIEQKFLRDASESPQIKSYAKFIKKHPEYEGLLEKPNTTLEIMQRKVKMLNEPEFLVDYYVFSVKTILPNKGFRLDNYVIEKKEMVTILLEPTNLRSPKKGQSVIRIPSKFLGKVDFSITTPRYKASELSDLVKLEPKEKEVLEAFGYHRKHIRPDVIKDLTKNLPEFIEKLIEIQEKYG